jgi:hypothetical protein
MLRLSVPCGLTLECSIHLSTTRLSVEAHGKDDHRSARRNAFAQQVSERPVCGRRSSLLTLHRALSKSYTAPVGLMTMADGMRKSRAGVVVLSCSDPRLNPYQILGIDATLSQYSASCAAATCSHRHRSHNGAKRRRPCLRCDPNVERAAGDRQTGHNCGDASYWYKVRQCHKSISDAEQIAA